MLERALAVPCPQLLDLLRGLPEKQVRADCCTEYRDDGREVAAIPRQMRKHSPNRHGRPRNLDGEHDADVGKQDKRQPLEDADIASIRDKDLQNERKKREADRVNMRRSTNDQIDGCA